MEITIREIRQGRYGRSIPCTRIHLSTKKMAERVSRVNLVILGSGIDDRSIFAAVYAMVCFWRIWTSGHGFIRKIMLNLITIYSMLSLMSRRHNWSWWLMNRFDQSTVQLVIRLFFLPCLLFPYRFLDFHGVRPVRRGWR